MAQKNIGDYQLRLSVLPMALGPKGANGERPETWPDSGGKRYSASEEVMTGGEQLTQGIRGTTGFRKVRIPGSMIPVQAVDRVKLATDEIYNVTGVARDYTANETVLTLDRVAQQSQPQ